jgi:O-antigen ligase
VIGLYFLYSIFFSIKNKWINRNIDLHVLIFPVSLYALMAAGFWFTQDSEVASKELEYKASMIVFPLLMLLTPVFSKEEVRKMIRAFVGGCFLFALIALIYGAYRAYIFDSREYLTYSNLGIYFHPTYMALYQSLALFWLVSQGVKRAYFFGSFVFHLIVTFCVILFIVMLASKAGLLSAIVAMIWEIWVVFRRKWNMRRGLYWSISSMALILILSYSLPLTSQRINQSVSDIATTEGGGDQVTTSKQEARSSTELRRVTWASSIAILLEHPGGVGIGNAGIFLREKYAEAGENYALEKNLNSHNQFLQMGVEMGWAGVVIFIVFCIVILMKATRSGSIFYMAFVGLCFLNFLFESFLEVQAGVVFFYFFLTVLNNSALTRDSGC